jgi:ribosomal-protein-alanine N-acetyltransferase
MPTDSLQTLRLVGERPDEAKHFAEICALFADPAVMRWLKLEPFTPERTREIMQGWINAWARDGFGLWVWRERASGRVIGRGGLRRATIEAEPEIELLYALRAEFWGHGFGTELARAVAEHALGELGLPSVAAWTLPTNLGSRRVMEKAGFHFERNVVYADLPHVLYRRRRVTTGAR